MTQDVKPPLEAPEGRGSLLVLALLAPVVGAATGAEVPMAELGPGEAVGGLTSEEGVHQVGVRCTEKMTVLVLPQTKYEPLLMALPNARQKLTALEAVLSAKA